MVQHSFWTSRARMQVELVHDGFACDEGGSRRGSKRPTPSVLSHPLIDGGHISREPSFSRSEIDSSDPERFLAMVEEGAPCWAAGQNWIVTHGTFIRNVARRIAPRDSSLHSRLRSVRRRFLFVLRVRPSGKDAPSFFLVRHCARQKSLFLPDQLETDPACWSGARAGICDLLPFQDVVRSLALQDGERVQTERAGGREAAVPCSVFCSCLRRSSETADVVQAALLRAPFLLMQDGVRLLPFVREAINFLGPFDLANRCSAATLERAVRRRPQS